MRRTILFIIAVALVVGGLYLLVWEFTTARLIFSKMIAAGGLMAFLGGYLLWEDFLAPMIRKQKWEP